MLDASQRYAARSVCTTAACGWARPVSVAGNGIPAPPEDDLARLVQAVGVDRDREAFVALFRHYAPRLKAFFMRSGLSAGIAEDLAQEAMLSIWRKASYYDARRAGVATWVFAIARNLRIDHLRRQPGATSVQPDYGDMESVERSVLGAERDLQVRRALACLSPEQQAVLRLSYYGEKSQSEIAGELGIPLGTVKSRVRLAMEHLRARLEDIR